ncbi:unnamed protein product [Oreochromis niloticus]|nr:unnamed protein product [Mustela putorius furo]
MLHGLPLSTDTPGPRQRAVMPATAAKVPNYNGLTPLEPYLSQIRLAARHNGWSNEEAATHLALALEGDALQVLLDLAPSEQHELQALTIALERRFGQRHSTDQSREQLTNRRLTGERADMRGKKPLQIRVKDLELVHDFWLADIQDQCIIGLDLLTRWGACIDTAKRAITLGTETLALQCGQKQGAEGTRARRDRRRAAAAQQISGAGGSGSSPLTSAPASQPDKSPSTETTKAVGDLWQRSSVGLNVDQRQRLRCLLDENVAEEKIREMAAAGVIELSNSPWAAPVVLVGKKDGSPRFCVDFRRLNVVTKKDSYPLPRIDEALDYVTGSSWFSSLDLRSSYWQVELAPEARPKTAFTIGQGLWQFRVMVMPFGLCNAPATFERLMERVLVNIPRSRCVVYLDDLLVHGGDFDSALSHLSEVFSAIRRAGLRLNPAKCRLLARETTFLGHVISAQGIATDSANVAAVRDWPTPSNVKELRSFLGLASFYRWFIKGRPCMAVECRYCLRQEERAQEALGVATAQATASGGGWLPLTMQQLKREQEADATLVQVGAWLGAAQRPDWMGVSGQEPKSATTTAERLVEEMFTHFGVPAELHSDQGCNFESKVFGEICRRLGVEKTRTTPLHPQSDGLVKRFNRTLATQLAIFTSRHQRDWDRHLPLVLWSYRTAVQESSQCTPAALMFGRELRTPVDLVFGSPAEPEIDGGPEMDYYRRLRERLQVVHDYTRQAQASAGVRQKRPYDTKCQGEAFVPGDKIWVYCLVHKRGVSPKLCSHWQGPAEVVERLSEVVYHIRMPGPGRMVVLHRDRLSPYRPLTPADAGAGDAGDTPGSDPSDFSPAGRDRLVRQKKAPGHLQDFVWGNGAVGDD